MFSTAQRCAETGQLNLNVFAVEGPLCEKVTSENLHFIMCICHCVQFLHTNSPEFLLRTDISRGAVQCDPSP